MTLRSAVSKSLQIREELKSNVLPTNSDVVSHYFYLREKYSDTIPKYLNKLPAYRDVQDDLINDITGLWNKASLPIVSIQRVDAKLKDLIKQFEAARRKVKRRGGDKINESWLNNLFDISKCKCCIPEIPKVCNKRVVCGCDWLDRIPEKEFTFLKDQRNERKMLMSSLDHSHIKKEKEIATHKRKHSWDNDIQQPSTSGTVSLDSPVHLTTSRLRPKNDLKRSEMNNDLDDTDSDFDDCLDDTEYQPKSVVGGKQYKKVKLFSINAESCVLADRRLTTIRQQSDQLLAVIGKNQVAASPATIYRHREKERMKALANCEAALNATDAIQLCYDGRVVNKMDRYAFLGQFVDLESNRCEKILGIKSFPVGASVTAEVLFKTITEETSSACLKNVYSVMADTTAINTGKKSGVNKRLVDFFNECIGHDIHTLECMFHVNEIYLTHVIAMIEGQKKGPGALQDGALLNNIVNIEKPNANDLLPRNHLKVPITRIAALHLKAKLDWFSQQKLNGNSDSSFRSDQMCMLVLASYIITDIPENLKHLLLYKQEQVCHSRWITTANGYLRTLIYNQGSLTDAQKIKLVRIVSYIISVYVPSFLMIHLKPRAPEGPYLTLFQRDLLLAYSELDPSVANLVLKYFLDHASEWLTSKNVALSVHAEVAPYTAEAVKTHQSLPDHVDIRRLLQKKNTTLKDFFTKSSKFAPCISAGHVSPAFWQSIDNHNRSTERLIGKLKNVIQDSKVNNPLAQQTALDIRLRAYLCNME